MQDRIGAAAGSREDSKRNLAGPVLAEADLDDRAGSVVERLDVDEDREDLVAVLRADLSPGRPAGSARGRTCSSRPSVDHIALPGTPPSSRLFSSSERPRAVPDHRLDGDEVQRRETGLTQVGSVDPDQAARAGIRPEPDRDPSLDAPGRLRIRDGRRTEERPVLDRRNQNCGRGPLSRRKRPAASSPTRTRRSSRSRPRPATHRRLPRDRQRLSHHA